MDPATKVAGNNAVGGASEVNAATAAPIARLNANYRASLRVSLSTRNSIIANKITAVVRVVRKMKLELAVENAT